jgi:hypothetical protein
MLKFYFRARYVVNPISTNTTKDQNVRFNAMQSLQSLFVYRKVFECALGIPDLTRHGVNFPTRIVDGTPPAVVAVAVQSRVRPTSEI